MTNRFTSAGAMLAVRAMTGDYFLALGRGESPAGLLEEATVGGYARQPVTIVARRSIGTNAGSTRFGAFAASAGSYSHAAIYTAARGGTCIWVGPLATSVTLSAGGNVTIAANTLSLAVALVAPQEPPVTVPANTAVPLVAGTAREGELLTASSGTWSGTAPITYAYQWQRGTTAITGATAATYIVQTADVGQTLRVIVTAMNVAGAAQAPSAATAPVTALITPPANIASPVISGIKQEGEVLTASTGAWSGTAPITYGFQWQRGATPIAGATAATYAIQGADVDRTLRVIVAATNSGGMMEAGSASTVPILAAPLPNITVATPAGPLATSTPLTASGSFSGTMTAASLVWEQNGNAVGQPVAITDFSAGAWTATITTPEVAGLYRLRATFNGTGPTATSDDVTIGTSEDMNLASFTFDGSGDGADTVAVFGHSFPAGALHPTAAIVLRRADNNAALRTQMTPLTTWPDGTVRTAAFAGELPALANGALLQVRLRRDEAHPSPGPALTWSGALSGRSITIRTWAPGNTTTPLWTYDVGAALLSSTDDWMTGPLTITRRVVQQLPTSAVRTAAGALPGPPTVRLLVDVTATKDGMLLADWCFANDRIQVAGGAPAQFGYTVEIDGTVVHDSRPATGIGTVLDQYSWWWRRRAKKGAKVYNFSTVFRPLFRPDYQVLVDSRYLIPYDLTRVTGAWRPSFQSQAEAAAVNDSNPYWPGSLILQQGAAGGREEIGYKTAQQFAWIISANSGIRRHAELVCNQNAECFGSSTNFFRDYEFDKPIYVDEWPRLRINDSDLQSSLQTNRTLALGLPNTQRRLSSTQKIHNAGEQQHRGPHYGATALLSARRMMYDALAVRGAEAVMLGARWNGTDLANQNGSTFNTLTPNWETGINWARHPLWSNPRGQGWNLRDIVEAAYLIPATPQFPRADFYPKTVHAWFRMLLDQQPLLDAILGGSFGPRYYGLQVAGEDGKAFRFSGFMTNFFYYGVIAALRMGLSTGLAGEVLNRMIDNRGGGAAFSEEHARLIKMANDLNWGPSNFPANNGPFNADTWAAVLANSAVPAPDWSVNFSEVDWQRNTINSMMLASEAVPDPARQALAREALVQLWSYRKLPNGRPAVGPDDFLDGINSQTNALAPEAFQYRWDTAPVLVQPAAIAVPLVAPAGALIGLIRWTVAMPRCTTPSLTNHDAFEIVSQPPGNPFTISRGGAIRRSATGTLTPGTQTLRVRARTISGNAPRGETEVTRWSNTVTVTVNVVP